MLGMLWTLGCVLNCPEEAAVEIEDRQGLLSEEERADLAALYSTIAGYMDADDVCVEKVVVRSGEESSRLGQRLYLGAEDPDLEGTFYWILCEIMAEKRDYNDGSLEWFGPDGDHSFQTICQLGPPNASWIDEVQAACGGDQLGDRDRFMLEEVYPEAPRGRVDGALAATAGTGVDVEGLIAPGSYGYLFAQAGGHLLFLRTPANVETGTLELLRIDPVGGSWEVVWAGPWTSDTRATLAHGPEYGALLMQSAYGEPVTAITVGPDGAVAAWETPLTDINSADYATDGQRLIFGTGYPWEFPLVVVELASGEVAELPTPELDLEGPSLLVNGLQAGSDGIVAELADADVESSYDFVSIGIHGYILARYDWEEGRWEELTRDLHILDVGFVDGRYLTGSVYSDAGRALAAYDLEEDALLVNDSVCLEDGYPGLAADELLLDLRSSGEGSETVYTISPFELSL
jgi:hypothetical protein